MNSELPVIGHVLKTALAIGKYFLISRDTCMHFLTIGSCSIYMPYRINVIPLPHNCASNIENSYIHH